MAIFLFGVSHTYDCPCDGEREEEEQPQLMTDEHKITIKINSC